MAARVNAGGEGGSKCKPSARMLSSSERTLEQAYRWVQRASACCSEQSSQQQPIQLHSRQRRLNGAHSHSGLQNQGRMFSSTAESLATASRSPHSWNHQECGRPIAVAARWTAVENTSSLVSPSLFLPPPVVPARKPQGGNEHKRAPRACSLYTFRREKKRPRPRF